MFSNVFRNQYFIYFLIVAVLLYSFSYHTARADSGDWLFTIGTTLVSIVLGVVSWWCGGCLGWFFESLVLGISAFDVIWTGATTGAGTAFCIGLSHILGQCGQTQTPDIYFLGTGGYNNKGAPPPELADKTSSISCNPATITLNYSLVHTRDYALFRDGKLIHQSETCMLPNDPDAPFKVSYTDTGADIGGLKKGTTYTYSLEVTDGIAQKFRFPDQQLTPQCN